MTRLSYSLGWIAIDSGATAGADGTGEPPIADSRARFSMAMYLACTAKNACSVRHLCDDAGID